MLKNDKRDGRHKSDVAGGKFLVSPTKCPRHGANSPRKQTTTLKAGTRNLKEWPEIKAHSNETIAIFEQEQAHTEVSIAQLATGSQPPKGANKFISKANKREELKKKFSQLIR